MEEDTAYAPISFEYLLSSLFGRRRYHGFVGEHTFRIWKKHVMKLIGAIQKSITVNVNSPDELHKKTLIGICEQAIGEIRRAKRVENINVTTIECLTKLVFELMGGVPDHWDCKVINRSEQWKLDDYRTLSYTQTTRQRVRIIHSLANRHAYSGQLPSYRDLWQKWWRDFGCNDSEFIQWFKQNYSTVYTAVF